MKLSTNLLTLVLSSALLGTACHKQASQQSNVDATKTDARRDISSQPSPTSAESSPAGSAPVTQNPNSDRSSPDSTLGTQQGAAVVNGANMNPSSASNVPTSVDNAEAVEPRSNSAVDRANCLDATNKDKDGSSVGTRNDCPPTAQSRIKNSSSAKDVSR